MRFQRIRHTLRSIAWVLRFLLIRHTDQVYKKYRVLHNGWKLLFILWQGGGSYTSKVMTRYWFFYEYATEYYVILLQ